MGGGVARESSSSSSREGERAHRRETRVVVVVGFAETTRRTDLERAAEPHVHARRERGERRAERRVVEVEVEHARAAPAAAAVDARLVARPPVERDAEEARGARGELTDGALRLDRHELLRCRGDRPNRE